MITEEKSYGIVVVLRDSEDMFLLLQHIAGHWGFPKGHKDGNETIKETALRELKEESGIVDCEIIDSPMISEEYTYEYNKNTHHKIVQYLVGFVKNKNISIQKGEIADYKWAKYDEALEILTYGNNKEVLRKAQEYISRIQM